MLYFSYSRTKTVSAPRRGQNMGLTGSSAQFGTRTSAIWQLHLDYADGPDEIIASGDDVRSARGGWDYADLFVGERFDRRAETPGWDWLRDTRPGQRIVIEHTETLATVGSWFVNIAGINKEQADVFVAAGGDDEWEPEFTFHGFRFARVSGLAESLDPADIVAVVIGSDLEQTGSFTTSDPRLNRLHQNVVWSQRGNFLSVPTDCPQRERVGWTGDLQAFVGAAANNAQIVPFVSRWLENLRADQLPDGRIPIFSPRSPFDRGSAAAASVVGAIVAAAGWSDAIAIVPWVLYERTGDRRVLEENYPSMVRWIEYQRMTAEHEMPASLLTAESTVESRAAQEQLYNTGLHFGDWLTPSTMESGPIHEAIMIAPTLTSEYIAPMFQANTLSIAALTAAALGKEADAAEFAARASRVRAAFAAEYVDAEGDLPVRLQGIYVLALAFEMVPSGLRSRTAARLVELVRERGNRLIPIGGVGVGV